MGKPGQQGKTLGEDSMILSCGRGQVNIQSCGGDLMILSSGGGKTCGGGEGNEDRPGYRGRLLGHSSLVHLSLPLPPSSFGCFLLCICSVTV